ncbi:MAG: ribulose-phosphate 3-epimerase [Candidatus Omnitrophica bacterium]|jgi:ribulose-phosphate 3-epimerase|nr:ribulose-phosphate 3-epimerase [Candidatus Omnitrophota bacterium]
MKTEKNVVPAILTDKKEKLLDMVDNCSQFCNYVQIDIMDGVFVPSKSISVADLKGVRFPVKSEAHLMVAKPLEWIEAFKNAGSHRIIYHFEIPNEHLRIIEAIKKLNLEVGLAINPSTKIKDFSFLVDKLDSVLFMSVIPGFYGSKFIPEVLDKIKEFKKIYPGKCTGIDGGVKAENTSTIAQSGVDYVCVGSAILNAANPKNAYLEIKDLLNE